MQGDFASMFAAALSDFLAEGGAVAGGGAAFGATLGFVAASVARTLGFHVEVRNWTGDGAALGGLFGVCVVALQAAGVS